MLLRFFESHRLLRQILPVTNNVRHAILSNCDFTAVNPLSQYICCSFVLACFLTQSVELLFKILDSIALFFDLAIIFVIDSVHDLLHLKLVTHFCLSSSSLASCLEDMHTSALGCYQNKQIAMIIIELFVYQS